MSEIHEHENKCDHKIEKCEVCEKTYKIKDKKHFYENHNCEEYLY